MESIQELLKNPNTVLVDVREADELISEGKIDQAWHIPMQEIPNNIERLQEIEGPIIVFCKVGGRAQNVINYLENQGFSNLHNGKGYKDMIALL